MPGVVAAGEAATLTAEQYAGIKAGVGLIRMVPWPADPSQWVGMRALSRSEEEEAYLLACQHAKQKGQPSDTELLTAARQDMTLWLALRNVVEVETDGVRRRVADVPGATLFTSPDHFRSSVTAEQAKKLRGVHEELCQTVTPLSRAQAFLQDREFEALARDLKKKAELIELSDCLLTDVMGFIRFLLERADLSASET